MASSIYTHFAGRTILPIPLEEIKDFILNTGEVSRITRYSVDMDEYVLKGMLRVYVTKPPYAIEEHKLAEIIYPQTSHPYEVRMACCKEMLHLLDNHHATACTKELVSKLVEEITLPVEAAMTIPGLNDHAKIAHALCVLLPKAALIPLKQAYEEGKLSTTNIASIAEIPEPWVRVAMQDQWLSLMNKILEIEA